MSALVSQRRRLGLVGGVGLRTAAAAGGGVWVPQGQANDMLALRTRPLHSSPSSFLRPTPLPLPLHRQFTTTSLRATPPPSSLQSQSQSQTATSEKSEKAPTPAAADEPKKPVLQRAWAVVKHEAQHYWHGSKLLAKEVRISSRLQLKLLRGKTLTRRERRQLKRTTTDLLRLIPFVPFVIIPFMEFLLPVALKLFPNMLPSTFEDKFAAEEKQRKLLRVRLEMAKFLHETIKETGLRAGDRVTGSEEFKEFFRKVRATGEHPSHADIVKVARLFNDDLTLDNLSRPQLVSMCRYMNIHAYGTDNFLRGHIRGRLEKIKADDVLIAAESISTLTTKELQQACQSRGIRTSTLSPARLRDELAQWIDLHVQQEVSGVLLILSKAFNFAEGEGGVMSSLEATLSSLPDVLLNEAELEVSSEEATYKQKLDVLQEQEELIEDEAEQEQKEEEARRAKKAAEEKARREEEAEKAQRMLPDAEVAEATAEEDVRMTSEQLGELGEALSILSAKSSVLKERVELAQIMEESEAADAEAEAAATEEGAEPKKTRASESLKKQVKSMLSKIDAQLSEYDEKVGSQLNLIQANHLGQISVEDLKQALRVIKHAPSEEQLDAIVKKLDVDSDGFVVLEDVLELAQEEGLGIVLEDGAEAILGQGNVIKVGAAGKASGAKNGGAAKPKKEDIVADE